MSIVIPIVAKGDQAVAELRRVELAEAKAAVAAAKMNGASKEALAGLQANARNSKLAFEASQGAAARSAHSFKAMKMAATEAFGVIGGMVSAGLALAKVLDKAFGTVKYTDDQLIEATKKVEHVLTFAERSRAETIRKSKATLQDYKSTAEDVARAFQSGLTRTDRASLLTGIIGDPEEAERAFETFSKFAKKGDDFAKFLVDLRRIELENKGLLPRVVPVGAQSDLDQYLQSLRDMVGITDQMVAFSKAITAIAVSSKAIADTTNGFEAGTSIMGEFALAAGARAMKERGTGGIGALSARSNRGSGRGSGRRRRGPSAEILDLQSEYAGTAFGGEGQVIDEYKLPSFTNEHSVEVMRQAQEATGNLVSTMKDLAGAYTEAAQSAYQAQPGIMAFRDVMSLSAQATGEFIGALIEGKNPFSALIKGIANATKAYAIQAGMRALFELAEAFAMPWEAPRHFAAAKFYGAAAAVGTAGAIAIGALAGGGGGGGGGGSGGGGGGGGGYGGQFDRLQSGGGYVSRDHRTEGGPTTINVYMGQGLSTPEDIGKAVDDALKAAQRGGRVRDRGRSTVRVLS